MEDAVATLTPQRGSKRYDLIVVGGGAAGLTAAMYAARRALKTLIITKDLGGQAATTPWIENYPGIDCTDGLELMVKFRSQAEKYGAELVTTEAKGIDCLEGGAFGVRTPQEVLEAGAVILAFGLTPRDLGVPGEERLKGRGVSYCVTCDGPLFKGKRVAVVGGGNAALDAANFLAQLASEVHLIHEREKLRGSEALAAAVLADERITKHLGVRVREITGEQVVTGLVLGDAASRPLALDGVFIELGHVAQTSWLKGVVDLDPKGQVVVTRACRTSRPGIFAAGDLADIDYKQVVISAGEGAKAALEAYRYLRHGEGKSIVPDWTKAKPVVP
jgi:thioredoxin reductase (NADPH)